MAAETFRCSDAAEARAEPLYGTASYVQRWVLLEQPGSWGRNALTESRLPQRAVPELIRRAAAAGVRVVLIRRGAALSSPKRRCYFARVDDRHPYLAQLSLESVDDLLDVDLTGLAGDGAIEGAVDCSNPVFLVCTHGRHDACCSIRGNRVARVACSTPGADAWECSHIGGDRFAANLVCFPHGVYYGRVGPGDVAMLIDAYELGRLSLDHYRGRCCYTFVVQAAEYFVRRESGVTDLDAVALLETAKAGPHNLVATFSVAGRGRAEVEVRVDRSPETYRLTCGATGTLALPQYEFVSCNLHA